MLFEIQVPRPFRRPKARSGVPLEVGEVRWDLARSKTPSMCGSTLRENREALRPPVEDGATGPRWEVQGHEPPMYGAGSLTAA